MVAEDKLNTAISKEAWKAWKGIRFIPVDSVVHKAAKKQRADSYAAGREARIKVEKPRAILKAARNMDLAEGECVGRNLARMEKEGRCGAAGNRVGATKPGRRETWKRCARKRSGTRFAERRLHDGGARCSHGEAHGDQPRARPLQAAGRAEQARGPGGGAQLGGGGGGGAG